MNKYYFNSIEEANKFIKQNNLIFCHFENPTEYEDGVDLVIDEFTCDICKQKTHINYEGAEPFVCCDCVPLEDFKGRNYENNEVHY